MRGRSWSTARAPIRGIAGSQAPDLGRFICLADPAVVQVVADGPGVAGPPTLAPQSVSDGCRYVSLRRPAEDLPAL